MIGMIGPSLGFQVESCWILGDCSSHSPIPSFPEAKASLKPAQGDHPGWFIVVPMGHNPSKNLPSIYRIYRSFGTSQLNQVLCTKVQDLCLQHFIKCSVWSYLEHDIPRELADQGAVRLRWTKCPIKWPFELSSIFDLDTSNCPVGVLARCGKHQRATIDNWHMSNTACQCQLSEEQTNNNLIHQMGLNPVPRHTTFSCFKLRIYTYMICMLLDFTPPANKQRQNSRQKRTT